MGLCPKGTDYHVELEVCDPSKLERTLERAFVLETFGVQLQGRLVGVLEGTPSDGVAVLRVDDSLVLVDCENEGLCPGDIFEVRFNELVIHDRSL